MKNFPFSLLLLVILFSINWGCQPSITTDTIDLQALQSNFQNPPNEARPRVWWHWMNGNITEEGIQKDLDWMERIGIGGFHNFDASLFTPQVTDKKLVFMTPEWKEAFKYTTDLAAEKGLEMTIAGSPGWSETGGPWVKPKDGMKKYVWTETLVKGGTTYNDKLPQPSSLIGKFQNIPMEEGGISGGFIGEAPAYYQDALVIAFPIAEAEQTLATLAPKVTSSGGTFSLQQLTDGDLHHSNFLPPSEIGEKTWIQYAFSLPQTFKALSVVGAITTPLAEFEGNPNNRMLQVSDDGITYRKVAAVSGSTVPHNTASFAPTTAKYWRLSWETLPPQPNLFLAMAGLPMPEPKPEGVNVAEFVLHVSDRIDQFEDKAGFSPWREDSPSFTASNADAITQAQILDLTDQMQADGTLNWEAPAGNWIVLRFGYSLTGRQNHPASPEATGLEVDKLDEEAVRRYINTYLDKYEDATGGQLGEKGLSSIILDSYEAGHMNWTHDFPTEFQERRAYELKTWLPVLTGRIVESAAASERFLWDFRKTIGEMIVENHYDIIGEELNERNMGRYTESHENKRIFLADGMDVKRKAEVPMAAMWTPGSLGGGNEEEVRSESDIRESASVANIYGQPYVAAESMTSVGRPFQEYPERLKRTADLELASGLNRFVIHTSVHQPLDDKMPGLSLGPFGQYFSRQETWAEQARPWIDYLARSCYLLQQGNNVADILYYYGENQNITWTFNQSLPEVPKGYEFDFVNATALIEAIAYKNGKLTAQSGNTYEVLVLDETAKEMTLPVLIRLQELVQAGAKVTGTKPAQSPSLTDDNVEFQKTAEALWNHPNVLKGTLADVLTSLELKPDVRIENTTHEILFRHRQAPGLDIYWLDNRSAASTSAEISFRGEGRLPKLWHPQTGEVADLSYSMENGRTKVSLDFDSWEAFFIVLAERTSEKAYTLPATNEQVALSIEGPWKLQFQADRGAPAEATFTELQSWTEREELGIKYFSGTATYQNSFALVDKLEGAIYELNLGEVKNIAEVILNGQSQGILWKEPFNIELNDALVSGQNILEIKVTNLWVNRLIGDAQPDAQQKYTFTTMPFYQANSALLPAGLLSAVELKVIQ